jgi:hypothetical protein
MRAGFDRLRLLKTIQLIDGGSMKQVLWAAFLVLQAGSALAGDALQPAKKAREVIPEPGDYDFAWDQFSHRGRMIWACRGVHTGQIVDNSLCAGKDMVDSHWPDKKISPEWKE